MLNNYSSMWAIAVALNSAAIFRLRKTWGMLEKPTRMLFEKVNTIAQASRNFAVYRDLIRTAAPPCVPFCGLYTRDLTFIEDGNPDYIGFNKQVINFAKSQRIADIIFEIKAFQSVS